MTTKDLVQLYDYSCWVNKKLFDVIEQLPQEDYTRDIAGSYGSVRNTMVHILSAEQAWFGRCIGKEVEARLNPEEYPTAVSLRKTWTAIEEKVRQFLSSLTEEDMVRDVEYTGGVSGPCVMPLGELMHHVMNHGAHHRGQVALLLRVLGYSAGNFDMLFYLAEKRGVSAW